MSCAKNNARKRCYGERKNHSVNNKHGEKLCAHNSCLQSKVEDDKFQKSGK